MGHAQLWRTALLLLSFGAAHGAHAALCAAASGSYTGVLVELYTSDRCAACPLARQRVTAAAGGSDAEGRLAALVFHVDERSYVPERGDPLARRRLTIAQRIALLHHPAVLVQGRVLEDWAGQLEQAVARVIARPAAAHIRLEIQALEPGALHVLAQAELVSASAQASLYLTAYERQGTERLAREWVGPLPFAQGRIRDDRRLALLPGAQGLRSGIAAFVQDRRSGELLQALLLDACQMSAPESRFSFIFDASSPAGGAGGP